jgi:hypothetical protein
MTKRTTHLLVVAVSLFLLAFPVMARVISYAPYTSEPAFPGVQSRMNRYFAMVEGDSFGGGLLLSPMPYYANFPFGKLVLYDSYGAREPKVIFPKDGTDAAFSVVAVRESFPSVIIDPLPLDLLIPTILIQTTANFEGKNPANQYIFLLSTDGGDTWKKVAAPEAVVYQMPGNSADIGGLYAKSRYSPVRIGTEDSPFVVHLPTKGIYAFDKDGTTRLLTAIPNAPYYTSSALVGSNNTGTQFIVRSAQDTLQLVDLSGRVMPLGTIQSDTYQAEGWITERGDVYLELVDPRGVKLKVVSAAGVVQTFGPPDGTHTTQFFVVPTYHFDGAWIIERGPTGPTILRQHTMAAGLVTHWTDVSAPQVEALHTGYSGTKLLIQVHRDRPQADQRLFTDPALAIWRVGEPAPTAYDELFMNEQQSKGFVHLDVEAAANGAPFVFDSGASFGGGGIIISPAPPSSGGGDVIQEWGVVRASLKQKLVLPGVGRTPGAYGSDWVSDVVIQNPLETSQNVALQFIPNGADVQAAAIHKTTLALQPLEIRLINDVVKSLFGLDSANGALMIQPDSAVNANSRTYTKTEKGSFGFNMNAIDVYTAVGPRFPISFAGAFPGLDFRTNLTLTDASGYGSQASLLATGTSGFMGSEDVSFSTPRGGQVQMNSIASNLHLLSSETGGLFVTAQRGSLIASLFTIDNRTNDPTYFPPDLPAPIVRTIPAIGHVDGANNSKFRSDLFLFNPSDQVRVVTLQVKAWDTNEAPTLLNLTLLPKEARVIRDVLKTAFNKTGFARLRYVSYGDSSSDGVRVTSRTYSIDENGGTYGFLMPPLNNFQSAASGDSLEILGAINDTGFRTNLGLVELNGLANGQPAAVKIEILNASHHVIDTFSVTIPSAGGMQINDLFRARNIQSNTATPVLIRVSPTSGMVGAYASMVDNGTNDPTYLAANLGAHD